MDDRVLFENEEWMVTEAGLEHRNGYFIEASEIERRHSDGLWSWPLHMAEKSWCTPRPFAEAFMRAVLAYGIQPDAELALSFLSAGRRDIERRIWEHVARELGHAPAGDEAFGIGDLQGIGAEVRRRTGIGRLRVGRRAA